MENVSEKKRGRGRPAKHLPEDYKAFAGLRAKTPRGNQNYKYAVEAWSLLSPYGAQFQYLLSPIPRRTILAELGRFEHAAPMFSAAKEICSSRMKNAKAVGFIRRMRGKGNPDCFKLGEKLFRVIEKFRERYQNVSTEDIALAIQYAERLSSHAK